MIDATKRLLLGRPVRTDRLSHTLLPKRIAFPVFASDALSSVAYAPDEIMLTLAVAGMAALSFSPIVGVVVALVMAVVIASYRQNVHAYPSGGGDYEVATVNLGPRAGLTVASALLVDYILTVAVSVSAGAHYASAAIPALRGDETSVALALILVLTLLNLRGVRESGTAFAVPVYLYLVTVGTTAVVGLVRWATGTLPLAESAALDVVPLPQYETGLAGLAGAFLVLRAFTSGSTALTGVEAISNGVPAFRPHKSRNAATTLLLLGSVSSFLVLSILFLAQATQIHFVDDPASHLLRNGEPVGEAYIQLPVIGQLSRAVFDGAPWAAVIVAAATGLILVLAANTAFNGFPVLGSVLARDGWMPRQLHTRGDRLALSNGIVTLAAGAAVLVWSFHSDVTLLIPLYTVGVFVSFSLSQLGMLRHWTRHLRTEIDPKKRVQMGRSRVINAVGFGLTSLVLIVVIITKFALGAWITILAIAFLFAVMNAIHRHYGRVREELAVGDGVEIARALPSRVHAIVLVSQIHMPTMRAVAYARATRPSQLEAVTVAVDHEEAARVAQDWDRMNLPVPLRVLDSPYREITRPILTYVRSIRRDSPRDLVVVYVPEYVVGRWWEALLHNQSAIRLKSRLLFMRGVVVASVPWQLQSSYRSRLLAEETDNKPAAGSTRRGLGEDMKERQ